MATLAEILNAAAELHELSPKAAERFSYSRGGGGDDGGGCSVADVKDPSGRICISHGCSWSGTNMDKAEHWGPNLFIDNKIVDMSGLDQRYREVLDAKIDKAFEPLFRALKREKREAPKRKMAIEKSNREKAASERAARNVETRKLIDSL